MEKERSLAQLPVYRQSHCTRIMPQTLSGPQFGKSLKSWSSHSVPFCGSEGSMCAQNTPPATHRSTRKRFQSEGSSAPRPGAGFHLLLQALGKGAKASTQCKQALSLWAGRCTGQEKVGNRRARVTGPTESDCRKDLTSPSGSSSFQGSANLYHRAIRLAG